MIEPTTTSEAITTLVLLPPSSTPLSGTDTWENSGELLGDRTGITVSELLVGGLNTVGLKEGKAVCMLEGVLVGVFEGSVEG